MGQYVNPGIDNFQMSLNSEIYVDKSNLIVETNKLFRTRQRFICISRPRRFGKTMAAEMLAAYYRIGESSQDLFKDLKVATHQAYEKHLNQYHVIMINMQEFSSETSSVTEMLTKLQSDVGGELIEENPEVRYKNKSTLRQVMMDIYLHTKRPFVILIDEWDCLFREYKDQLEEQKIYLDFLRVLLKDQVYVGLAYMTGILPIKKYGTHSALNMFREYTMTHPRKFISYFGFTKPEVEKLADGYKMDFDEIEKWYNGYFVEYNQPIYNPTSVTECLESNQFASYWNKTETYEALKDYIMLDFDGLREKVTLLLAGESLEIDTRSFTNDMTSFESADDVLTLLVHLGYLTYNFEDKTVRIPNEEVRGEFMTSIKSLKWNNVVDAIKNSDKMLSAIWNNNPDVVTKGIEQVHEENTSILAYNDENALSCVISLALYTARDYYTTIRELPTGKGYADLVFIPRKKHLDKPAIVVELKWNQTVTGAIDQIKEKNYMLALDEYKGDLLLVGINYDKSEKVHTCVIESLVYG